MIRLVLAALLLAAPTAAAAQTPAPAPVTTPVGRYDTTIAGQPIVFPEGPVQVTASETRIPPGGAIAPHKHPFQRLNYVLEGTVRVTNLDTGTVAEFHAGQVIVESRDLWHKGEAVGAQPVRLLALDETPPGQSNLVRKP